MLNKKITNIKNFILLKDLLKWIIFIKLCNKFDKIILKYKKVYKV